MSSPRRRKRCRRSRRQFCFCGKTQLGEEGAFLSRKSHKCQDQTKRSAKMTRVPTIMVRPTVGDVCRMWFPAQNSKTRTISRSQPRAIKDLTRAHLSNEYYYHYRRQAIPAQIRGSTAVPKRALTE